MLHPILPAALTCPELGNYPGDREGWGRIGVIVFVPTSGSKLCAPDPPFNTGDGFWSDVKEFFGIR